MFYYLFDVTVTIKNEENQKTYREDYFVEYPDGTEKKFVEADAEYIMNGFADACSECFYYEFGAQQADVQTDLDAYMLTEEEYNRYKEDNEEGE